MTLTADLMLRGYAEGIFPMAESQASPDVFWMSPERRGVIPIGGFHVSRSLARRLRSGQFSFAVDRDFAAVVDGCADRPQTWINPVLRAVYLDLHARGAAHSVEVRDGDALVGGVFGICLGGAFFGETMFSRRADASKAALVCLVDRLRVGGFRLFDTQFLTSHLASLGGIEISRADYLRQLRHAIRLPALWLPESPTGQELLQRMAQTS